MNKWPLLGGGFALLITVVIAIFFILNSEKDVAVNAEVTNDASVEKRQSALQSAHYVSKQQAASASQHTSERMQFVLYIGVKDSFDRFIFAQDEASAPEVIKRYSAHSMLMYEPVSLLYAIDVFTRYVEYKVALARAQQDIDVHQIRPQDAMVSDVTYTAAALSDVEGKLEARAQLRRLYFSQREYDYLFSLDAGIDKRALERLAIASDKALSKSQKRDLIFRQLDALEGHEKRPFKPTIDMYRLSEIKQTHSDTPSRYNAIAAEFGHAVAERFSRLWEEQAQWKQKVNEYQQFREGLKVEQVIDSARQHALQNYLQTHFSETEQKRLRVIVAQTD